MTSYRQTSSITNEALKRSRLLDYNTNNTVAKVHSLNQCSKCKRVNYGYSYGSLHVVGMLTGMTATIINSACGIGINAGHRTSN